MNKKLKFKGSMKRFMRWPLYLTILLVLLNVLIFTVNVKAGLLSLAGLVIYVAAALLLTHYHRPMILNDLIAFANQYESLEKQPAGRSGTSLCHYGHQWQDDLVK